VEIGLISPQSTSAPGAANEGPSEYLAKCRILGLPPEQLIGGRCREVNVPLQDCETNHGNRTSSPESVKASGFSGTFDLAGRDVRPDRTARLELGEFVAVSRVRWLVGTIASVSSAAHRLLVDEREGVIPEPMSSLGGEFSHRRSYFFYRSRVVARYLLPS
jgi:hypothetical protein